MKNLVLLVAISTLLLSGCSKKDNTPATVTPATPSIGAVPSTFTQKVLIEEFTASWCGYCPNAITAIDQADSVYPGKINAVAFQEDGDPMATPATDSLIGFFSLSGPPQAEVNRTSEDGFGTGQYPAEYPGWLDAALSQTAVCGVALDATGSNTTDLTVTAYAGFNTTLTGPYRLVVYLIENPVQNANSQYNQENYMTKGGEAANSSSPWYTQPGSMPDFAHPHVLRTTLSGGVFGDSIPVTSMVKGQDYIRKYTIPNSSAWNYANLYFVVSILKYSPNGSSQQIMNSQVVQVGKLQNWD